MKKDGIYLLFLGHYSFNPKVYSQNRHSASAHFFSLIKKLKNDKNCN